MYERTISKPSLPVLSSLHWNEVTRPVSVIIDYASAVERDPRSVLNSQSSPAAYRRVYRLDSNARSGA